MHVPDYCVTILTMDYIYCKYFTIRFFCRYTNFFHDILYRNVSEFSWNHRCFT